MSQSIEIRADGSWVFHGGDDGDSRLRDPEKNAIPNYRLWNPLWINPATGLKEGRYEYQTVHRVYCRSCGADGGISARTSVYIVYYCEKHAQTDPNFIPMPPDEEFRWRQGLPPRSDDDEVVLTDG